VSAAGPEPATVASRCGAHQEEFALTFADFFLQLWNSMKYIFSFIGQKCRFV
jgi:hypothetical protein